MTEQEYKLNLVPDKVEPYVLVCQHDTARKIIFDLYNGDEEYVPTTVSLKIGSTSYALTKDGNKVYLTLPSSLTDNVQIVKGEVIADNMGSLNFTLEVESVPASAQILLLNKAISIIMDREMSVSDPQGFLDILNGE